MATQRRILVIEDDHDVAHLVRVVLERSGELEVLLRFDGADLEQTIREHRPDVLVTDVELPDRDGLELARVAKALDPDLPVVVMTAHASVDYAVRALRHHVDEFLEKPLATAALIATVERLAALRAQRCERRRTVLAIGAHPDDVELGVGGTLSAHVAAGDAVVVLTLSRGARGGDADHRQAESMASAELLGARLFLEDLADTSIAHAEPTVGIIERVVEQVSPSVVYTHSSHDRHQDHRAVHAATLVATRGVAEVACYQSPSTTIEFRPTRFVTIDRHLEAKQRLLACFASQQGIRPYLDPQLIEATARYWGRFGDGTWIEPLEVVRDAGAIGADDRSASLARDQQAIA
ncbi:response regulator [Agrococcus sp. SGAir0287]|uniref:response regulator n=1 Tax=Agrococcus sp. SGAir0287 TaxID=2070347 RepID=UPI0010CCC8A1|nr:response regulator [Agrococcus sp. SGAir0287]QCR19404.1 hypothetical protein C1N71_08160 [Agrococcus sp. SGAir0287]